MGLAADSRMIEASPWPHAAAAKGLSSFDRTGGWLKFYLGYKDPLKQRSGGVTGTAGGGQSDG